MKFEDTSQNLRARLRFIQALVVVMLGVAGQFGLYVLQVVRGETLRGDCRKPEKPAPSDTRAPRQ